MLFRIQSCFAAAPLQLSELGHRHLLLQRDAVRRKKLAGLQRRFLLVHASRLLKDQVAHQVSGPSTTAARGSPRGAIEPTPEAEPEAREFDEETPLMMGRHQSLPLGKEQQQRQRQQQQLRAASEALAATRSVLDQALARERALAAKLIEEADQRAKAQQLAE